MVLPAECFGERYFEAPAGALPHRGGCNGFGVGEGVADAAGGHRQEGP